MPTHRETPPEITTVLNRLNWTLPEGWQGSAKRNLVRCTAGHFWNPFGSDLHEGATCPACTRNQRQQAAAPKPRLVMFLPRAA